MADSHTASRAFRSIPHSSPTSKNAFGSMQNTLPAAGVFRSRPNGPTTAIARKTANGSTATTARTDRGQGKAADGLYAHLVEMLRFTSEHRYVTTEQLRRRFAQSVTSTRSHYRHIQQLRRAGLLLEVPIRHVTPSHPRVYITGAKAHRLISAELESQTGHVWRPHAVEQRRPGRQYGLLHVAHEIGCTWVDVAVEEYANQHQHVTLHRVQRRYLKPPATKRQSNYQLGVNVIPDAGYYLTLRSDGREWFEWFALEYDRATMSIDRVLAKLWRYQRWAEDPDEGQYYLDFICRHFGDEETQTPNFRLLIVAKARAGEGTGQRRLDKMLTAAQKLPREMRRRIWGTTHEALHANGLDLSQPIWQRLSHSPPRPFVSLWPERF